MKDTDLVGGDITAEEGVGGSPIAPPWGEGAPGALQGDLEGIGELVVGEVERPVERFSIGWVDLDKLSDRAKYRLLGKGKQKMGRNVKDRFGRSTHWKAKKKRRRETYQKSERRSKLARDRWLMSDPEGLWYYYQYRVKYRGFEWNIDKEAFVKILKDTIVDGLPIYKYVFNIYRIDKNKDYYIDNITILDRYTNKVLY